jgi:hypothetical protein
MVLVSCGSGDSVELKSSRTPLCSGENVELTDDSCVQSSDATGVAASSSKNPDGSDSNEQAQSSEEVVVKEAEGKPKEDQADKPDEEKPPVVLLTTFDLNTKKIWKPCADACHSANGANRTQKPFLDVYEEAKMNVNRKRGGHKRLSISNDNRTIILDWVADGLLEKQ